jgi:hypothetical protein
VRREGEEGDCGLRVVFFLCVCERGMGFSDG